MDRRTRELHRASACLVALLVGCEGGDTESAPPPSDTGSELTFEVLYAGIDRRAEGSPVERGAAIQRELLASPADVVCLQGVWDADTRRALTGSLRGVFPHVLDLTTGEGATVDPVPGHEALPPAEGPACDAFLAAPLDDLLHCLWSSCSGPNVDGDRAVFQRGCLEGTRCLEVLDVLDAVDPTHRCGACARAHLRAGVTFDAVDVACTAGDRLIFEGDGGMALLSRIPFESVDLRVLPASSVRRLVTTARLARAEGPIDVHCASLGPAGATGLPIDPLPDDPYPGPHGEGGLGWERENGVQVDALIAFVQARSGAIPAVVLGNFGASSASTSGIELALEPLGAASAARLESAFVVAADPSAPASCTSCPSNPLQDRPIPPTWPNRVYLHGLGADVVVSTQRTYLGRVVEAGAGAYYTPQIRFLPLAPQYGTRTTLRFAD